MIPVTYVPSYEGMFPCRNMMSYDMMSYDMISYLRYDMIQVSSPFLHRSIFFHMIRKINSLLFLAP